MHIPAVLVQWIAAFLCDRQQRVILGREVSDWIKIHGAVPQWSSWLGPLLFIIMINDLKPQALTYKFMDDTSMSESFLDQSSIQEAVNYTTKWSEENNMKLNPDKTKDLLICFKKNKPDIPQILITGTIIEEE